MLEGKNSELVHGGLRYHIQTEVVEKDSNKLITQVFLKGQVVYQKRREFTDTPCLEEINSLHNDVIVNIKEMML